MKYRFNGEIIQILTLGNILPSYEKIGMPKMNCVGLENIGELRSSIEVTYSLKCPVDVLAYPCPFPPCRLCCPTYQQYYEHLRHPHLSVAMIMLGLPMFILSPFDTRHPILPHAVVSVLSVVASLYIPGFTIACRLTTANSLNEA